MTDVKQFQAKPSTTLIIYNKSMASANTEYSQALPSGVTKIDVKLRAQNALLKIAFISTESGSKYITIPYGSSFHLENTNLEGKTLYFQSPSASQVCEIICWT